MQLPDQGTHSGSHVCNLRDGCVDATWSPPHVQAFSSSFQPITCFFSGSSKNISARSIMATFCGGRDYLIIRNDLSCSGEVGSTRTLWIWQPTPPFFWPQRAYMLWCLLRVEEDLDWRENVLNRHGAHSWNQRSRTYRVAFVREPCCPIIQMEKRRTGK